MSFKQTCPRCDKRGMKTWSELSDDEREAAKRLPLSADYSLEERQISHIWCTRCWFEKVDDDNLA